MKPGSRYRVDGGGGEGFLHVLTLHLQPDRTMSSSLPHASLYTVCTRMSIDRFGLPWKTQWRESQQRRDELRLRWKALERCSLGLMGLMILTLAALAQSPKIGDPPEAKNMRPGGHQELHRPRAYPPPIPHQGSRYIAYIGHHGGTPEIPQPINRLTGQAENNGTSIVDVTDPAQPKYLAHIPGLQGHYEEGGAQMVRVCDGKTLPKGDA